jgi:hypothetical protein
VGITETFKGAAQFGQNRLATSNSCSHDKHRMFVQVSGGSGNWKRLMVTHAKLQ